MKGEYMKFTVPEGAEVATDCDGEVYFWIPSKNKMFVDGEWESCDERTGLRPLDEYLTDFGVKIIWYRDKLKDDVNKNNSTNHGDSIKPVKSDGGSSSYYFTTLPEHLIKDIVKRGGIEIKDIVRYCFDNDADCKDIIKALKRIRENLKGGGKEGVDNIYDANKICFFAEELRSSLKECSKHV